MGLEMVEFVMELEDRFDVEIPDAELDGVYTFGDFYRLICAKTNPTDEPGPCPTPGVFLRLRTALCEVVGVRSSRIRPDTPLVELIPPETRLAAWPKLEHAMGLKLSPLSKPEWVHSWAAGGGCLGVILGCILAGVVAWWMLPIVWALAGAWVTVWELRTGHLALELPPHIRTVGDLVKSTVGLNLPRPDTGRAPSREAIWQGIVDVAVEELQSPVEYVRPDVIISDVADWYPPPGVDYRGHAAKPPRTHPGGIAVDLDLPLRRPNIVLDLEYDCGVRLSGHELLSAHTVWDLYQLTLSRRGLTASQPNECPSSEVFNALRRALIDGFGVSRSSVGLDARMEDLVPARRRRKAWAAIREATGLRLPQLEPSPNATGNAEGLGCLFGVPPAFIGVLLGAAGMSDGGLDRKSVV